MASNCEMTDKNVKSGLKKFSFTRMKKKTHTSANGIGTFFSGIAFLAFVRHLLQMV